MESHSPEGPAPVKTVFRAFSQERLCWRMRCWRWCLFLCSGGVDLHPDCDCFVRRDRLPEKDWKMDGERLKNQVVTIDQGRQEKLEMEEHLLVPKIVHIARQVLEGKGSGQGVQAGCRCTATARHVPTEYVRSGSCGTRFQIDRGTTFSWRCHTLK